NGGPPSIDMWDMKPDAPSGIRGEFKQIDSRLPGLRVCEHLPMMGKDADKLTFVRSVPPKLPLPRPGQAWMNTGNSPIGSMTFPSLGSLAARLLPVRPDVPGYVSAGGKGAAAYAGYLGAAFNPFVVDTIPQGKSGKVATTARPQMRGVVL